MSDGMTALQHMILEYIRVPRSRFVTVDLDLPTPWSVEVDVESKQTQGGDSLTVGFMYDLKAVSPDAEQETVWHSSIQVDVALRYAGSQDLTPEFIEEFVQRDALLMAHPYAREALQSMSYRAGIEPFVLPMITRQWLAKLQEEATQGQSGDTEEAE